MSAASGPPAGGRGPGGRGLLCAPDTAAGPAVSPAPGVGSRCGGKAAGGRASTARARRPRSRRRGSCADGPSARAGAERGTDAVSSPSELQALCDTWPRAVPQGWVLSQTVNRRVRRWRPPGNGGRSADGPRVCTRGCGTCSASRKHLLGRSVCVTSGSYSYRNLRIRVDEP